MQSNNTEPKPCNFFAHYLGRIVMYLTGWTVVSDIPKHQKMIVIAAPHTSNWDFIYLLGAAYVLRLRINWLGKNSLFLPLFGSFLKFLGGVPVDRSQSNNLVQNLAKTINTADQFALVVPPSGTRKRTDYWKSGFYRIATTAQIPVVCGYLDYEKKEAGLKQSFLPSGEVSEDMDRLRAFYQNIVGKHPENTSRIRLREEDAKDSGER